MIRSGYIIWFVISLISIFISSSIYYLVSKKWHWQPFLFSILLIGIAVIISIMAFVSGMTFAVEATGEMLIVAIGFDIIIPWLSERTLIKIAI